MSADGRADAPILLTGASGFLGSWIARRALDRGLAVIACDLSDDRRRFAQIAAGLARVEAMAWRTLDVTDAQAVTRLVARTAPRAIVHLAALQIPACAADPRAGARVNVEGQVNVLQAAREAGGVPVVYASSIAAKPRGPENAPSTLYGVYKHAGEEVARLYWRDHRVPSIGLRPYIVYGVGRDEGETSALTLAMRAAAEGRAYQIPFRGRFCFQYAPDVADRFLDCARASWRGALVSDLSDALDPVEAVRDAILAAVPDARIGIGDWDRPGPDAGFDTAPVTAVAGPAAPTPLDRGVAETVAAFRRLATGGAEVNAPSAGESAGA